MYDHNSKMLWKWFPSPMKILYALGVDDGKRWYNSNFLTDLWDWAIDKDGKRAALRSLEESVSDQMS